MIKALRCVGVSIAVVAMAAQIYGQEKSTDSNETKTSEPRTAPEFHFKNFDPPTNLDAWKAVNSGNVDVALDSFRGNPTVLLIFRGHGCFRCVQQLGKFANVERKFRQRGVRLTALSNEQVSAVKTASSNTPLPFPVLTDPTQKLAQSLGSKQVENWHGILILDANCKGRWLASGSKPLMDCDKVLAEIDRLRIARETIDDHQLKSVAQPAATPTDKVIRQAD